ncbi:MAG TPA: hypothetical protein VMW24_19700 [Sedimentisphaerales bacterium]|nr:hypothetical protein [Sedimentisphaerales bacterium]HUV66127.1 hypothetical protein [Sedimentisphaerales bacterium]
MAKHELFLMASIGASSTTATPVLPFATDFPNPSGPAWEAAVDVSLHRMYGSMTVGLLSVVIVCVVCLLCTAVWLLAVRAYLQRRR